MKKADRRDIFLIEDHQEAYYIWKKRSIAKSTLVHLDAHLDFGFQEIKDLPVILREARTISELRTQLEKAVLFHRKRFDPEKLTHLGNYIYPAMRDGIVDALYWVVPGGRGEFERSLGTIRGILRDLRREDPFEAGSPIHIEQGAVRTCLYGKPFHVSCLDSLPLFKEPVLLDIDIDFFVVDTIRHADTAGPVVRREPWIGTGDFVRKVREKILQLRLTTIAYSVNGGFTPMVQKTLGDRLALELGGADRGLLNRLRAGEDFQKFREAFDRKDFLSAKVFYDKAVKRNPAYRVPDNNDGPTYFRAGKLRWAEREWQGMLKVDRADIHALTGLGKVRLVRRRYREAADFFSAALNVNPRHPENLAGLAEAAYRLKHYEKAQSLLSDFERLDPMQDFSRYLSGRILEKTGRPREALEKYKEALQLGRDDVDLLARLVRLSRRFEKSHLIRLGKVCRDYRAAWMRSARKELLKRGKKAEARKTEERFKKLLAFLRTASRHGFKPLMKSVTLPSGRNESS
jgi:tetratricopeptide (TPR) repeat protein